jgi:hypothetical protein
MQSISRALSLVLVMLAAITVGVILIRCLPPNEARAQWHYQEEEDHGESYATQQARLREARANAPIRQANATEALQKEMVGIRAELQLIRAQLTKIADNMKPPTKTQNEPATIRLFVPQKSLGSQTRFEWRDIQRPGSNYELSRPTGSYYRLLR